MTYYVFTEDDLEMALRTFQLRMIRRGAKPGQAVVAANVVRNFMHSKAASDVGLRVELKGVA